MGVILGEKTSYTHIMNIKRNISFKLEKRKSKGMDIVENVPIRMRVTNIVLNVLGKNKNRK